MTRKYEVIVGNIGTVFETDNKRAAQTVYEDYVERSKSNFGRGANQAVVMMFDGEIEAEYNPPLSGCD